MPMRTEFFYDSCGAGKIRACRWMPEGTPKAIVQILHGIAEHIERYDHFAEFLATNGILVVAEDHMGHGKSIGVDGVKGYFHGGWFSAVQDSVKLHELTTKEYPDTPYILFGHSMGSFMARTILAKYPELELSGAVICGTGWQSEGLLKVAVPLCNAICKLTDEKKPNQFLDKVIFGGYNKKVEHPRTKSDWLSRDPKIVDAYVADNLCGFVASSGLLRDMLSGIAYIQQEASLKAMNRSLPCFFIAGGDDPVGDYGNGVKAAAEMFEKSGMNQVKCKIYPLCRHEILNEINRTEVYSDVLEWIGKII